MDPLVSLVMPVRNNEATVEASVRSVLSQTFQDWELIAIDDGSSDRGVDRIRAFQDGRILVAGDRAWRGLPVRLNEGVALARGRYVARLDADDLCYPDRLATQVAFLDTHPSIDLVAGWAMFFTAGGAPLGVFQAPATHAELCAGMPKIIPLVHPSWLGRREWFDAHAYDPAYRRIEDQELLIRAMPASEYACVQQVVLGFRLHAPSRRRIRNEILDQFYHLRIQVRWAARHGQALRTLRVFTTRAAKLVYRPAGIALGLGGLLSRRSLRAATEAERNQFRAVWLGAQARVPMA